MKSVNDTAILKEKKNLSVSSKTLTFDLPISISDALSLLLMSFVAFDGFFYSYQVVTYAKKKTIIDYRFCARN